MAVSEKSIRNDFTRNVYRRCQKMLDNQFTEEEIRDIVNLTAKVALNQFFKGYEIVIPYIGLLKWNVIIGKRPIHRKRYFMHDGNERIEKLVLLNNIYPTMVRWRGEGKTDFKIRLNEEGKKRFSELLINNTIQNVVR